MPFRRAPAPPDVERVAQVLRGGRPDSSRAGTRVESAGARRVGASVHATGSPRERATPASGWVPTRPRGSGESAGPAEAAVPDLGDELDRLDADLRRARRPALLTAPEQLRLGRWSVSSGAVVAVLALVVALGCAFAIRILWAERAADAGGVDAPSGRAGPVPSGLERAGQVTVSPAGVSAGAAATVSPTTQAEVVVHVVGQVARPGLVRLAHGSRVADAIAAAGGARSGADVGALNLARILVDGEQVYVPKPGEAVVPPVTGGGTSGGGGGAGAGSGGSGGISVNLNTADLAALDTLPGVGPVLAQRIVDWRTEHGRFTSVDELGEVSGIGDKLMAQLRPKVTV